VTPKGQRAFRDAERRHGAKVAKLFAGLSRSELETLIRLLDKLRGVFRPAEGTTLTAARKELVKPRRARPSKKRLEP
jgi:hypothetical protein